MIERIGKTCFKCGIFKPIGEFYGHKRMADGHLNKCKGCTKKDVKDHYASCPAAVVATERKRSRSPERRAKKLAYNRDRRRRLRVKIIAHDAVSRAIHRGRLVRQPCEVCGTNQGIEAHHDDYSRPLDVRWFCFKHHREVAHGQRTYGHLSGPF
jgi:Fe-S-cluster-containing hydrogenase component 2